MDHPNLHLLLLLMFASTIDAQDLFPREVAAESCRTCLNTSASDIHHLCPLQKEAVLSNENCTVQYSNASIFGTVPTDPDDQLYGRNNVTSPDTFNAVLRQLLDNLHGEAMVGGSQRKYAMESVPVGFDMIYAMVQCEPDLTEQQCSDCMVTMVARLSLCCARKMGVRITAPSCQFQYETNAQFLDPIGESFLLPPAPRPQVADALPPPPGTLARV